MKLPAARLGQTLKRGLESAYLIAGDEPLLVAEAAESVRKAAAAQGFTDRELHVTDRSFDWSGLLDGSANLSLFAERRLLEVRLPTGRPGEKGGRILRTLVEQPDPDRLLVVVAPKLDASVSRSAWVKSFEKAGVWVQVWPLDRSELPGWIAGRLRAIGLEPERAGVERLAERTEGNLLATNQEIEKLRLICGAGSKIDADTVDASVGDNARFDVFRFGDAVLSGQAKRAVRMLNRLKGEGVEPTLILWSLTRDLGVLYQLAHGITGGMPEAQAFKAAGVWPRRQPLLRQALRRLPLDRLRVLTAAAARADRIVKGQDYGQPWDTLSQLTQAITIAEARL